MNNTARLWGWGAMVAAAVLASQTETTAAPPFPIQDEMDYKASGFLMPAGARPAAFQVPASAANAAYHPTAQAIGSTMPNASMSPSKEGYGLLPVGYQNQIPYGYAPSCDAMPAQSCQCGCDSGSCESSGCNFQGILPSLMGNCGSGQCGGYGQCDGYGQCGCGGGDCGCGGSSGCLGEGGLLGRLNNDCNEELCPLRHMCLFCRGEGCEACQMFGGGQLLGMLGALKPYAEAGRCSQRWYDISVEGLFLSQSLGGGGAIITNDGRAPLVDPLFPNDPGIPNNPVLRAGDGQSDSLEAGVRVSAAMIFGAGGNLELTYMGGQNWGGSGSASSPTANLFSFVSDFGRPTVFDDVDQSVTQSIRSDVYFHSGEFGYRRRTVGPYCRFQGSWLFGLRYLRYDNAIGYNALGTVRDRNGTIIAGTADGDGEDRFFRESLKSKNNLFGPQIGGDLWWNVMPGIQLGVGLKGAWMQNDYETSGSISSNSIGPGGLAGTIPFDSGDQKGTVFGEFETTLIYRLSHSWSFRTSYLLMGIDDVANPALSGAAIRQIVAGDTFQNQFTSVTLQGFTLGAEYIW